MKKAIFISIIAAVFAFLSISSTRAQVSGVYKANIPFDFSVGKRQYPAGLYNVEVRGTEKKFFVFRDSRGRGSYLINTRPGKEMLEETASLDFRRIGGSYYLQSIQAVDLTSSVPIYSSEKGLAQNRDADKVTVLLATGK